MRLAEGLLRSSAASLTSTLPCRADLPAVERGRDLLQSRLTIVQSSEAETVTGVDRCQFRAVYGTSPYRHSVMRRLDDARGWLRDARPLPETALKAGSIQGRPRNDTEIGNEARRSQILRRCPRNLLFEASRRPCSGQRITG